MMSQDESRRTALRRDGWPHDAIVALARRLILSDQQDNEEDVPFGWTWQAKASF
jgi:hypothetical protein